jgi:hypothetical protein
LQDFADWFVSPRMDRPYSFKEMAKITAGAVAAVVIIGWIVILAISFMSAG